MLGSSGGSTDRWMAGLRPWREWTGERLSDPQDQGNESVSHGRHERARECSPSPPSPSHAAWTPGLHSEEPMTMDADPLIGSCCRCRIVFPAQMMFMFGRLLKRACVFIHTFINLASFGIKLKKNFQGYWNKKDLNEMPWVFKFDSKCLLRGLWLPYLFRPSWISGQSLGISFNKKNT